LEFIKINYNDISIIHDINKDHIYNQFLRFTKNVFVVVHGFKDEINIYKIKNSKLDNKFKIYFEYTYNNYINKIKMYNKIIVVNPKLSEIYNKKYKDKDILYIPTCIGSEIKNNIFHSKLYYNNTAYNFDKTILKSILNKLNKYINIVYIGRMENFKNIITIIESIKNIDNISLTLIGSISDKTLINRYNNVIFIDKISNNEINNCFDLFDITINLSLFEGLPQIVLESGLNKKTCILSNLFGFKELNHYGKHRQTY
jgi:glycosyltransferase involved in cell wall biosynthesis